MWERIASLLSEELLCLNSGDLLFLTQIKERFKPADFVGWPGHSNPNHLHSSSCVPSSLCVLVNKAHFLPNIFFLLCWFAGLLFLMRLSENVDVLALVLNQTIC